MYQVRLFGTTEVRTPAGLVAGRGFGGIKPRNVLQLLVLHRTLHKSELADLLWQGSPPADHVATLESYVCLLRRRLAPKGRARESVIVTRNGGYALDLDRVSTDVGRFDALLAEAAARPAGVALPLLSEAVRLAAQPLLADEPHATWAVETRDRYRARLVRAATGAAGHALATDDADAALTLAARAVELDPLAERAWQLKIMAYRRTGNRAGALTTYHECRRHLATDLGVTPSPATQRLFMEALRAGVGASDAAGSGDEAVVAVLAAARDLAAGMSVKDAAVALLDRARQLASRPRVPLPAA